MPDPARLAQSEVHDPGCLEATMRSKAILVVGAVVVAGAAVLLVQQNRSKPEPGSVALATGPAITVYLTPT